jgi:hypothetical protein
MSAVNGHSGNSVVINGEDFSSLPNVTLYLDGFEDSKFALSGMLLNPPEPCGAINDLGINEVVINGEGWCCLPGARVDIDGFEDSVFSVYPITVNLLINMVGFESSTFAPGGLAYRDSSLDCQITHFYSGNFEKEFCSVRDDNANNCNPALRCLFDKTLREIYCDLE